MRNLDDYVFLILVAVSAIVGFISSVRKKLEERRQQFPRTPTVDESDIADDDEDEQQEQRPPLVRPKQADPVEDFLRQFLRGTLPQPAQPAAPPGPRGAGRFGDDSDDLSDSDLLESEDVATHVSRHMQSEVGSSKLGGEVGQHVREHLTTSKSTLERSQLTDSLAKVGLSVSATQASRTIAKSEVSEPAATARAGVGLAAALRNASSIRQAIVIREILGPPLALRRWRR